MRQKREGEQGRMKEIMEACFHLKEKKIKQVQVIER